MRSCRFRMSHSRNGPLWMMPSGITNVAKQSGISTFHRMFGTQKRPNSGASCSVQSMSLRKLRS